MTSTTYPTQEEKMCSLKLYKRYHDEEKVFETSLEAEREILDGYFHDVDYLAEPGAYPVFDSIPEDEHSFKTIAASYYWIVREEPQTGSYVTDEAIESLAKDLEKMRPDVQVLVALVPYSGYQSNGDIWVEITDVWTNHRGTKMVKVETLTGNELFQEYIGLVGWIPTDKQDYPASSLNHLALIEDGRMVRYYGRCFSKSRSLVPEMPEWMLDGSYTEYVLRQQELVREAE